MSILASGDSFRQPSLILITKYASGDHKISLKGCILSDRKAGGDRGVINSFSPQAIKRCRLAFRATSGIWEATATLTYPGEFSGCIDGRETKRHLDNFIKAAKKKYRGLVYAWVLEFQETTKNPHYHVLFNQSIDKDWLSLTWYRIVGSGLEKHLLAGTNIESIRNKTACADYCAKYLTKTNQKTLPDGFLSVGRWWGMSRGILKHFRVDIALEYDDPDSVRRDLRNLKRARVAKLREYGIKWRPKQSGYTDMQTSEAVVDRLVDCLSGRAVDPPGSGVDRVPF